MLVSPEISYMSCSEGLVCLSAFYHICRLKYDGSLCEYFCTDGKPKHHDLPSKKESQKLGISHIQMECTH